MFLDLPGKRAIAISSYRRPYSDPILLKAGDAITPQFARETEIAGWVWCVASDGRAGWTPRQWIREIGEKWIVVRDYSALELDLSPGEQLSLAFSESGFVWAKTEDGREGWAPHGVLQLI